MSAPCVLDALRQCLSKNQLLHPQARLLAAVSGGSDSMALLAALNLLKQEIGFSLYICHVQHGLRGEDSLADEQLVRDTCLRWQLSLTVHHAQLGGDLHLPGMETRAREERRRFFASEIAKHDAHALLLAHHQDDQAETLLMHLFRGAGTHGLAGMQQASPFAGGVLLRPFLHLTKQQLKDALSQWAVPYREDASNQEALTPRNALRLEILPALEKLFPGCSGRMAQAALHLRRDDAALDSMAQALVAANTLQSQAGLNAIDRTALRQADEAIAIRALRLWYQLGLEKAGIFSKEQALSADDSEALLQLVQAENAAPAVRNLPHGLEAYCGSRWLYLARQSGEPLEPSPSPLAVPLEGWVQEALAQADRSNAQAAIFPLPGFIGATPALQLQLRTCTPEHPPQSAMEAYVPLHLAAQCTLRAPRPGDALQPFGAPGHKPLRRYLTDQKIDPPFRPHLPVLALEDTILWIPGLCTGQQLAYQPDVPCLCLTLTTPPPYLPQHTHKGDDHHG